MVYLDTHLIVWLCEGKVEVLPESVVEILEKEELRISPMVELELQYLYEIKMLKWKADAILADLGNSIGLEVCRQPFETIVMQALRENWTRDPFDRMIVAQARLTDSPLITKDRNILKAYTQSMWI